MNDKTDRIRELNDEARKYMLMMTKVMITHGIKAMGNAHQAILIQKVSEYDDFTEDNDPHGEHDFGAFDYNGEQIFWKIDYYNEDLSAGSEDPASAVKTVRVLTIMLADEY